MEPTDYKRWVELQRALEAEKYKDGIRENKVKTEEEEALEDQLFEAVSKRAWTDVLLQLLKVQNLHSVMYICILDESHLVFMIMINVNIGMLQLSI